MSLWAFRFVLWYICIMLVQPQNRFPFLWPWRIANLAMITAILLHVFSAMQERRPLIRLGPATVSGLLLAALAFISLYTGVFQSSPAWNPYIDYLVKNVVAMVLVEAMATTVDRVWAVQTTLCLASLWWLKGGLRLAQAGVTHGGDRIIGPAVSLVSNPNNFAYMMCVLIPLYLHFYQRSKQKHVKLAFLAMALSAVYIVFQTGSRTGMMILIALGFFLLPRYGRHHKLTLVASVVAIFFLFSLVGGMNVERFKTIPNSIRAFLAGEVRDETELSQDDQSAQERRLKNRDTLALIRAYPLFGVGVSPDEGLFADKYPMATGQVHCEILMAGRQMGLIGMSLYAWLLVLLALWGWRVQRATASSWPAIAELGWTFKMQALVFAVGGAFAPLPWNAVHLVLLASVSALWTNLQEMEAVSLPSAGAELAPAACA